jgi:membrane protein
MTGKPDPYGRDATRPYHIPLKGWWQVAQRVWTEASRDNLTVVAAGCAFYALFAIFPALSALTSLYGLTTDPATVEKQFSMLSSVLPAEAYDIVIEQIRNLAASSNRALGWSFGLSIGLALWSVMSLTQAIFAALNIAYEEKEKRGLVSFYLLAVLMTFGALLVALCALAATAAVAFLQRLLPQASLAALIAGKVAGYGLLASAGALIASIVYRFGPSREDAKWKWITPGSLFTAVTWLLLTVAFGFYVAHFTNYRASYGSLGAVVALLTWLYLSAYAFVIGAELNSEIEHQTAKDSTTGAPKPLGSRGAWAADNVATDDRVQDRPEEAREGEKLTEATAKIGDETD